jgi:arabinogalactan oligomer/maltooligosaccharide transport system substrate-binding protein
MHKFRYAMPILLIIVAVILAACGGSAPTADAPSAASEPSVLPQSTRTLEPTETAMSEAPIAGNWTCPKDTPTVSIWHGWQGVYLTNIEAIFDDYQRTCPNVKLKLLQKPDMNDVVATAVPAVEGPDIIAWVNDQISRNAETGIIVPLDNSIDMAAFDRTFIPTAANAMKYAGKTWCYPESMEAITMIYNKDLISEADLPTTTDELLTKAAAWNAANPGSYYFVYNAKNDAYFSAPWWQGAGVTIIDEEGNTTFASDAGYAAGEFINNLRDVMPDEIDYGIADSLFKDGKAPIIMNGPWYITDLDAVGINYGLATLPVFSGTDTPAEPFVGVKCLMLTTNATKRGVDAAAINVMEYYTSKDSQIKLAETNKMVPTNAEAAADPAVTSIGDVDAFGKQAALGVGIPNTPFMGAMWDPIAKGVECIWTESSDVQTCVNNIQSLAEENIARMHKLYACREGREETSPFSEFPMYFCRPLAKTPRSMLEYP